MRRKIVGLSIIIAAGLGCYAVVQAQNTNPGALNLQGRLENLRSRLLTEREWSQRETQGQPARPVDWSADRKFRGDVGTPGYRTDAVPGASAPANGDNQLPQITLPGSTSESAGGSPRVTRAPRRVQGDARQGAGEDQQVPVPVQVVESASQGQPSGVAGSTRRTAPLVDQPAARPPISSRNAGQSNRPDDTTVRASDRQSAPDAAQRRQAGASAAAATPAATPAGTSSRRTVPKQAVTKQAVPEQTVRKQRVPERAAERTGPRRSNAPDGSSTATTTVDTPTSDIPRQDRTTQPSGEPASEVLVARKSPLLSIQTLGPRTTTIGKESTYVVRLQNLGAAAAGGVVVRIDTPPWVEVISAEASQGTANIDGAVEGGPIAWAVDRLNPRSTEKLSLQLVPRKSDSFDLAVGWSFQPEAAQTLIEVQEPKLALQISGPGEVQYGETRMYRLSISNPGTGDADNVEIQLMPLEGGTSPMAVQRIGTVAAGSSKTLEVELTARQAGDVNIHAIVSGDAGLRAEASEQVLVRRAALAMAVAAPKAKYAGTLANCEIQLSNPGNASAENIRLTAALPPGAELVDSSHGGTLNDAGDAVQWTINTLGAQNAQTVSMSLSLTRPGENRLLVDAEADQELAAEASAVTKVVALADLKLQISDPRGPIPVGEEMVYELTIRNRGTKAAQDVEIVAFFAEGIEPVTVKGGQFQMGPGQVVLQPLASLAVGEEAVYKIIARANRSGNHVFRAEVQCRAEGTRLAAEETTHFFEGSPGAVEEATTDDETTPGESQSLPPS